MRGVGYHLLSGVYELRSHPALDNFSIHDFKLCVWVGSPVGIEEEGAGTGVNIGLSTIGLDKACIAYSAAYTFAYSFLLLLVYIGCFLLFYGILGWEGGGFFWEEMDASLGINRWDRGVQRLMAIARAMGMEFLQLCDNFMFMMMIDETWACQFLLCPFAFVIQRQGKLTLGFGNTITCWFVFIQMYFYMNSALITQCALLGIV